MNTLLVAQIGAGLVLLVVGAELLVRGAAGLAARLGITPLVVGLTVVAFGTSAPELAVSVDAGLTGRADIALGNVVGSNIANILLILGATALVAPLVVHRRLLRLDVPLVLLASVALLGLSLDGRVGTLDGLLLMAGIVAYTAWCIRSARGEPATASDGGGARTTHPLGQVALVVLGLALLVLGAHWLVDGASAVARWLGVDELVIGLTVVAVGTSLPELATSAVAALRGERDIAVGNVLGSCLFNILAITGIAAVVTPGGLDVAPALVLVDMPVMIAATLVCLPIFATGRLVARWEGALLFAWYAAYVLYLVLDATGHRATPAFGDAVLGVALPVTAVALFGLWAYQHAAERRRRPA